MSGSVRESVDTGDLIMGWSRGLLIGNLHIMIIGGTNIKTLVMALSLRFKVLSKNINSLIKIIIIVIMIKITKKKRNLFRIIRLTIIYRLGVIMIISNK